jgi:uridine phosphorylase
MKADRPKAQGDLTYHLHTGPGDISPLCLIVGAPGRADMIAEKFLTNVRSFKNPHRGLTTHTGEYKLVQVSVTTSGMGSASTGIVLPEAYQSGGRIFIRVGSCGSLIKESQPGDAVIVTSAIRYDGASENWAPMAYPAVADWRVVGSLVSAAEKLSADRFHVGVECTTSCFMDGQGRPDLSGQVSPEMQARHEQVMRLGAACYSMEAATLFVWCATKGGGLPCGAVNAVFANRHTNAWATEGEEMSAQIALDALVELSKEPSFSHYFSV